jgi:periplasmic mercuric ion binding protein
MRLKKIILSITLLLAVTIVNAQSELKIKTSAECEMCKQKLESNIVYEMGIKFAKLNLDDKVLTVNYNPKKTSPEKIKAAISKLGYDADEVKADSIQYLKLPECCRKPGIHHND